MRLSALAAAIFFAAAPTLAQQQPRDDALDRGTVISPILTIDSERAFRESVFGKNVAAQVQAEIDALEAENTRIQSELETEEQELTVLRETLPAEEFRDLADAFDEKVQATRASRTNLARALNAEFNRQQEVFLGAAQPVLERLMREAGAAVILERRSVYVSVNAIDITDEAISLLDETLGSGEAPNQP